MKVPTETSKNWWYRDKSILWSVLDKVPKRLNRGNMLGFACLLGFGPGSEPPLCKVSALPLSYTLALRFHHLFGHGMSLNYLLASNSFCILGWSWPCNTSASGAARITGLVVWAQLKLFFQKMVLGQLSIYRQKSKVGLSALHSSPQYYLKYRMYAWKCHNETHWFVL